MVNWLKKLFKKDDGRTKPLFPGQSTWVYCPECKHELCSDPEAFQGEDENSNVTYKCPCGCVSRFLFGPPVPIYLGHTKPEDES